MPRATQLSSRPARITVVLLTWFAAGCAAPAVDWTISRSGALPSAAPLSLSADGLVRADPMAALSLRVKPPAGVICPGSLRLAQAGVTLHGVWWAPRADSGALLLSARSSDAGASWTAPVPVDTLDRGVNGCRRQPPSIAADPRTGYVHVAYALQAPEGPGLFFSHSMDDGALFHAPVPIFYGEQLGRTSVAADGDLVVVGFEDPNSRTGRIGLALSRTMGHIFEERLLPVSNDNGEASHPMTAVRGNQVAVAWEQRAASNGTPVLAVRAGTVP